ncbi:hypothetical protein MMC22_011111 [Lobaria immixta]|nr:hypothetical protein [Lobaria immixta]
MSGPLGVRSLMHRFFHRPVPPSNPDGWDAERVEILMVVMDHLRKTVKSFDPDFVREMGHMARILHTSITDLHIKYNDLLSTNPPPAALHKSRHRILKTYFAQRSNLVKADAERFRKRADPTKEFRDQYYVWKEEMSALIEDTTDRAVSERLETGGLRTTKIGIDR